MESARIAGIIAECNPFHEGHRYLIRKVREETGADRVVLVMSGAYVQRGEPAVVYTPVRTEMALAGGADAVFLLPARYATSSAESFATAGVRILAGLGCDIIAFGAEHTLPEILSAAAALSAETPEQGEMIRQFIRMGYSYPKARAAVFPAYADLLSSPNDILAVEYARALSSAETGAYPSRLHAVRRISGPAGDTEGRVYPDARGSALREALLVGDDSAYRAVPECTRPYLQREMTAGGAVTLDDFSLLAVEMIRRAAGEGSLTRYADVSEELADALAKAAGGYASISGIVDALSAKNRISSRVKRAILHILLGIEKEEDPFAGLYTQLLGFRKDTADVLAAAASRRSVPMVTKAADHETVLPPDAQRRFLEDVHAEELYGTVRSLKTGMRPSSYFSRPVIIV